MIDVSVVSVGADLARYARSIAEDLKPAGRARLALLLAQVASGEIASSVRTNLPKNPTGRLARSFKPRVIVSGDDVTAAAVSDLVYARIHDKGGAITPKRRQFLAIPLKGVRRGQRPREFPRKLTFIKTSPSSAILAERVGKRLVPRYALKKRVTLARTDYVREAFDAFERAAPPIVDAALKRAIEKAEGRAR